MSRMTPERLAEIERKCEINGTQMYFGEVLQALKAERERVEELEVQLKQEKRKSDLLLLAANTWQDKCEALGGNDG